jgi:aryl-alcohol dehydrogenase-like predicted oxidoreductase
MSTDHTTPRIRRRDFLKASAAAAGAVMLTSSHERALAATPDDGLDYRNYQPERMQYAKLGQTDLMCSRLVFGCGAALAGGKAVRLLERAFAQGVNFYDVGYDDYYKGSEKHLAPFWKRHRDEIWVTSKAPARVPGGGKLNTDKAKQAASYWAGQMDLSLQRLETDYMDAYYYMGVSDPELVQSEEMHNEFLKAKSAGKVGHLGISTHENAKECLEAATETGWFSVAMIAVTPAGWYDYRKRELLNEKGNLSDIKPVLDKARAAGIGICGMKAARPIAQQPYGAKYGTVEDANPIDTFDKHYPSSLMKANLSPFQRSYAFCLQNGVDVCNADMQNFKHFEENLIATRDSKLYFA